MLSLTLKPLWWSTYFDSPNKSDTTKGWWTLTAETTMRVDNKGVQNQRTVIGGSMRTDTGSGKNNQRVFSFGW